MLSMHFSFDSYRAYLLLNKLFHKGRFAKVWKSIPYFNSCGKFVFWPPLTIFSLLWYHFILKLPYSLLSNQYINMPHPMVQFSKLTMLPDLWAIRKYCSNSYILQITLLIYIILFLHENTLSVYVWVGVMPLAASISLPIQWPFYILAVPEGMGIQLRQLPTWESSFSKSSKKN